MSPRHFTDYLVYLYEGADQSPFHDDHTLAPRGRVGVPHELGEQVTAEMVRTALEARLGALGAGKYRLVPPVGRWGQTIDMEIVSSVEIVGPTADAA